MVPASHFSAAVQSAAAAVNNFELELSVAEKLSCITAIVTEFVDEGDED